MLRAMILVVLLAPGAAARVHEVPCTTDVATARYEYGAMAECRRTPAGHTTILVGREMSGGCDPSGKNTIVQVGWRNEVSC